MATTGMFAVSGLKGNEKEDVNLKVINVIGPKGSWPTELARVPQ